MEFPDQGLKRSSNMTPSIDEMVDAGIGSSSGLNRGPYNDLPDDCNPCNHITEGTEEINGENAFGNNSTGNEDRNGGDSDENREEHISSEIKKSCKRHSPEQIRGLETFFEKNSHPNEEQRKELGRELHLDPEQVKFWFQNKRTHTKAQYEKYNTTALREEKETLIAENISLQEHSNKHDLCQLCVGTNYPGELSGVQQLILSNVVHKQQITVLQEKNATSEGKEPLFDSTIVLPLLTCPVQNHLRYPILGEINGPVNPIEPMQGPADPLEWNHGPVNLFEPIQGPSNYFEPIHGYANALEPIHVTVNPLEPTHGLVNPSEPMHGPVNPFEPIHGNANRLEPIHVHVDPFEPIHGPVNSFEPIQGPVNPFEPTHGYANPLEPIHLHVDPLEPIHGPVNSFEPIHGPMNPFEPINLYVNPLESIHVDVGPLEPIHGPVNLFEPIHGPVNSFEPIHGNANPPEPVNGLVNSFEPIHGPVNSFEPIHGNANPPELVNGLVNSLEPVQVPTNTDNKKMMIDLALSAVQEFVFMAQMNSSLWLLEHTNSLVLNEEEYSRLISKETGPRPTGFRREASKETTIVKMSSNNIVKIFMDEKKWSTVFSDIVASATTLEVLSTGGQESYHSALHLMNAEFQVLSPLVPTRESCFLRYCSNNSDGSWTVVDISLDDDWQSKNLSVKHRRKPSGCLIEDLPGGYSKVTWVEHVEVDNQEVHDSYSQFIHTGLAFGAKRWISILKRHYQHITRFVQPTLADIPNKVILCTRGTRSMLMLAKRMVVSSHEGVSSSIAKGWTDLLPGSINPPIHLMVRKNIEDPGHPSGTVLSASSSFWLPTTHERVFGYLRNQHHRHEWDVLLEGRAIEEIANVPSSEEEWNCLSLLRVYVPGEEQNKMLILQENHSDENGSFITYASFKYEAINAVLEGWGDPAQIALLPYGFAIFPDGLVSSHNGIRGCLVTISFQMLLNLNPYAEISNDLVTNASNVISSTIARITKSLGC